MLASGHICAEHRMYGGLAFAQEKINSPLAIITLAPGVQEPCTSDTSHQCPTETVPYVAPRHEILCRERRAKAASSVDLSPSSWKPLSLFSQLIVAWPSAISSGARNTVS